MQRELTDRLEFVDTVALSGTQSVAPASGVPSTSLSDLRLTCVAVMDRLGQTAGDGEGEVTGDSAEVMT